MKIVLIAVAALAVMSQPVRADEADEKLLQALQACGRHIVFTPRKPRSIVQVPGEASPAVPAIQYEPGFEACVGVRARWEADAGAREARHLREKEAADKALIESVAGKK